MHGSRRLHRDATLQHGQLVLMFPGTARLRDCPLTGYAQRRKDSCLFSYPVVLSQSRSVRYDQVDCGLMLVLLSEPTAIRVLPLEELRPRGLSLIC